ncbi:MAG: pyridoxine 5'-phosphate synthase [Acidobacteriota bacterium]|nr:pyridoxine 5'-phosphate synthase [Acidobacteriota bacterium]
MPENPGEITTEGGLNVRPNIAIVRAAVNQLRDSGIVASLFIDPDPQQIEAAREVNAQQVELCTAAYAEATLGGRGIQREGASFVFQAEAQEIEWNFNPIGHRGQNGRQFIYVCPANGVPRVIYGTDIYTDDSSVCTAAVHAGLITF